MFLNEYVLKIYSKNKDNKKSLTINNKLVWEIKFKLLKIERLKLNQL